MSARFFYQNIGRCTACPYVLGNKDLSVLRHRMRAHWREKHAKAEPCSDHDKVNTFLFSTHGL